jgi:hypothetical protein
MERRPLTYLGSPSPDANSKEKDLRHFLTLLVTSTLDTIFPLPARLGPSLISTSEGHKECALMRN